ncbi:MAG: efflux RND transporter periplasmic adaptor subunit [Gammaproteobacteria bacterium]|nr:efflux RND transporter periplasmic adaptor subunit [Gammaproteobacteria bacterium]
MNRYILFVIYFGVFCLFSYSSLSFSDESTIIEGAIKDIQPEIYTVRKSQVNSFVRLGGSIVPEQIINLNAQMPGDVMYVAGAEGDEFRKGDRLVSLDTKKLLAKRQQAISQLASADAGYRNALVQYNQEMVNPNSQGNTMLGGAPALFNMFSKPTRSMTGQGNPNIERSSNLYAHSVQVETAKNQVTQAKAALKELDESLKNANSYAPFDGVILKKMIEKGDIVQPGMPLVSFADINRLQIRVEVPTRLLKVVKSAGNLFAKIDGEHELVPISVDRVFPMADAGGHTTTVKFSLNKEVKVQTGMYTEVILPDPDSKDIALPQIPQTAIIWRGSLPAVYKVDAEGNHRLRLIRVDEMASNGMVRVISGINVGDEILIRPNIASLQN